PGPRGGGSRRRAQPSRDRSRFKRADRDSRSPNAPLARGEMVPKDYYVILGVWRAESPSRIRARYRDVVRTLHPDVAGAHSTSAFQGIAGGYQIFAGPGGGGRST